MQTERWYDGGQSHQQGLCFSFILKDEDDIVCALQIEKNLASSDLNTVILKTIGGFGNLTVSQSCACFWQQGNGRALQLNDLARNHDLFESLIVKKGRAGRVVYEVNVGSSIWVRHDNQLRASYLPVAATLDPVFPLEILLDTFELAQKPQSSEPMNEPANSKSCAPRRWTDGIRRLVIPMQLNPQQQCYDQALQRGVRHCDSREAYQCSMHTMEAPGDSDSSEAGKPVTSKNNQGGLRCLSKRSTQRKPKNGTCNKCQRNVRKKNCWNQQRRIFRPLMSCEPPSVLDSVVGKTLKSIHKGRVDSRIFSKLFQLQNYLKVPLLEHGSAVKNSSAKACKRKRKHYFPRKAKAIERKQQRFMINKVEANNNLRSSLLNTLNNCILSGQLSWRIQETVRHRAFARQCQIQLLRTALMLEFWQDTGGQKVKLPNELRSARNLNPK
ncbi:hypothetical protein CLF_112134, partial [Clonorchis sinensis]